MTYIQKKYDHLLGTPGFSNQLLKNHFTLYQGYVTNTNKLIETLAQLTTDGKTATPEFAELKRRFGWEFNGMRLHELYFGNMINSDKRVNPTSPLAQKITTQFGSFDSWQASFKAVGTIRGIGWVILCYDNETDKLFNIWVNEHDVGYLATTTPLLIMDIFEHAFMLDYGLKRADYISAFFNAIDWSVVEKRLI